MQVPPQRRAQIAARYPSQFHTGRTLVTIWLVLNTRLPPFDDVRVRRALSYAIDRNQWARLFGNDGDRPTCQVLPPNFPGYRPYCPYTVAANASGTWIGPDLARAKQLIAASHTKGTHITVWYARPFNAAFAPYLVSLLDRLGYHAQIKWFADPTPYMTALRDSRSRAQIAGLGWQADYPGASNFIDPNFSCRSFLPANPASQNITEFCDPAIDKQITRARALDASDPGAANLLWTRIEHQIVDKAPVVPLVTGTWSFIVSKRVGNFQVQAPYGSIPLLDQLWVK